MAHTKGQILNSGDSLEFCKSKNIKRTQLRVYKKITITMNMSKFRIVLFSKKTSFLATPIPLHYI